LHRGSPLIPRQCADGVWTTTAAASMARVMSMRSCPRLRGTGRNDGDKERPRENVVVEAAEVSSSRRALSVRPDPFSNTAPKPQRYLQNLSNCRETNGSL